jgi:hypothetical protein
MSNRNIIFIILLLVATAAAGWLVDWWLAAGAFVGAAIVVWIYQRRYSVIDEAESEIMWYARRGWQDQPEGENNPYWSELWRPVLLVIAFIVALVVIAAGILR